MYLSDLGAMARRRWYLVLVGLLMTAGLVAGAFALVPVQYQASAEVVLLPPKLTTDAGANPYLSLDGLGTAADVLARAMSSQEVSDTIKSHGGGTDFVVERDFTTSGPVITVTVTDSTRARASDTLDLLLDQIPLSLNAVQASASVKPSFWITSEVITQQRRPTASRGSQSRAAIVAFAAGLTITLLLVALVDGWAMRRQARQASAVATADASAPPQLHDRPAGVAPADAFSSSSAAVLPPAPAARTPGAAQGR